MQPYEANRQRGTQIEIKDLRVIPSSERAYTNTHTFVRNHGNLVFRSFSYFDKLITYFYHKHLIRVEYFQSIKFTVYTVYSVECNVTDYEPAIYCNALSYMKKIS